MTTIRLVGGKTSPPTLQTDEQDPSYTAGGPNSGGGGRKTKNRHNEAGELIRTVIIMQHINAQYTINWHSHSCYAD